MGENHDGRTGMNERENEADAIERSRRFQAACELMKKNAANLILSSSSSEDEVENGDGTSSISEVIVDCLICLEAVRRNDKTWSCDKCYGIFHLHCIQKWAKDSLYQLASDSNENQKESSLKWCCPKCRNEYSPFEQPKKYLCFCEKVENPVDIWSIPHSCGKKCNKQLKPDCSHTCSMLCHPGPCPPCPQAVLVSCCCSKSKPVPKICSKKDWSCEKKCDKLLSCQHHFCEEVCHKESCPPCKKQSKQKCLCGNESKLQPCANSPWTCEKICMKPLKCGNHSCEIICHAGACPVCPNSGRRTCPCSKKTMSLPCTEIVPPCGYTCNKHLECEIHRCSQRCHFGPCEKCFQMRVMKCRCGRREKSIPCCKQYVCDVKCKCRRDCGKHFCNRRCCIGQCPPCEVPCGKTLNCGSHKCSSTCHQGPCYPCRESVTMTCNCGVTKITVPCDRKKSVLAPRCFTDCRMIIKPFK